MPALFSPDSLRASLQPLAAGQPISSEALAYQRYYGLDFPHRQAPVKRQLGRFTAGGYEIVSQVWWPASSPVATLFVIHGFYDHMGLYRHVIEWGLDHGFVVIACDLPGHGLSSGERASIDDFARYQAVLQGLFIEAQALQLPQPWHLCGQSTGGAILIDYLLTGNPGAAIGETILLAPLVRPIARTGGSVGWHLYVVQIDFTAAGKDRATVMRALAALDEYRLSRMAREAMRPAALILSISASV